MKSLGYLYTYGDKTLSSQDELSKDRLREAFGRGITVSEEITLVRRRFKSHKEVGQQGKRNSKKTKQYYEKNSSPKYVKRGRSVWL